VGFPGHPTRPYWLPLEDWLLLWLSILLAFPPLKWRTLSSQRLYTVWNRRGEHPWPADLARPRLVTYGFAWLLVFVEGIERLLAKLHSHPFAK
jgi:hypothetical protein